MYALVADEYYQLTGDPRVAELVVAIADSVYCEGMLPEDGALGYFPFYPRYGAHAVYAPQMAALFHVAFERTGDLRFLRAARAAFARYLMQKDPAGAPLLQEVWNFGWLDPELGGWILEHAAVATEPFDVKSAVPTPDPSMFGDPPGN
jgi:hypothetical protein